MSIKHPAKFFDFILGGSVGSQESRLFSIMLWAFSGLSVLALLQPLCGIFLQISNDYGEGWNAYWVRAAMHHGQLYPVSNDLVANNYPPLYYFLDGYLGKFVGDDIFAGRMIAFAALLVVTVVIARIVYLLGASRRWAWMSSLIFFTFNLIEFREFVAVDNPQWLAQAATLIGLLFIVRVEPSELRLRDIIPAAGAMVTAALVKHNLLALPFTITLWLAVYNRKALVFWCLSGILLAAIAIAFVYDIYGSSIFIEMFGFKRTSDLHNFLGGFVTIASLGGLIVVALASVRHLRADPRCRLLLMFCAIGVLSGVVQRLGAGVFLNAHFDGLIGLVLVFGTFLARATSGFFREPVDRRARAFWLLVASAPLLLQSPFAAEKAVVRFLDIPQQQAKWAGMISRVRTANGPALCEILAVCYWAGRPMGIDFFAYGQRLRTGTDARPLERAILGHRIAIMVVNRNKQYFRGKGRLPQPFPTLIEQNYRIVATAKRDIALMVPRN